MVLIPVNHNNMHWTAAAINFRRKRIESYDSMNMNRQLVFKVWYTVPVDNVPFLTPIQHLRHYLDAEHRNKKKKPFDFTGWEDYTLKVCRSVIITLGATERNIQEGHATTRERIWLRGIYLPILAISIQGWRIIQLHPGWYSLSSSANDLGDWTGVTWRWFITFISAVSICAGCS